MTIPAWWLRARASLRCLAGLTPGPVPESAGLPPHSDFWALCAWAAEADPNGTPPLASEARGRAEGVRLHTATQNLRLEAAARRAETLLAQAGLGCLRLKGLALLPQYPSGGLRPMEDVDLLVEPGQLQAAQDVLLKAGYTSHPLGVPGPSAAPVLSPRGHSIDLHSHLLNRRIPLWRELGRETDNTWWQRRVLGRDPSELSDGAHLAFVAAHAGKHWLVRGRWLADLALLIGGGADLDEAVHILREAGLEGLGRGPLHAVRDILGLPIRSRSLAPLGERTAGEDRLIRGLQQGTYDFGTDRLARFLPMIPTALGRLRVVRDTVFPGPKEARERFGASSYPGFLFGRVRRFLLGDTG